MRPDTFKKFRHQYTTQRRAIDLRKRILNNGLNRKLVMFRIKLSIIGTKVQQSFDYLYALHRLPYIADILWVFNFISDKALELNDKDPLPISNVERFLPVWSNDDIDRQFQFVESVLVFVEILFYKNIFRVLTFLYHKSFNFSFFTF